MKKHPIGDINRYEALKLMHETIKPDLYFEIGIKVGKSINLTKCYTIGIDPYTPVESGENRCVYKIKSNDFFNADCFGEFADKKPDLIFIDGMHLFEQVLLDFINCESISKPETVIVLDDVLPYEAIQAERVKKQKTWAGDCWKLIPVLFTYRPDLRITLLNTAPTGMMIVQGLDFGNTKLKQEYENILGTYHPELKPPEYILKRHGVGKDTRASIKGALCW